MTTEKGTIRKGVAGPVARPTTTRRGGKNKTMTQRGCSHSGEGVCDVHGEGAVLKWQPSYTMTRGTRGKLYKKYVKEWYYECDLNLRGDGKLTQTKLSFPKMTPNDRKMRGGC